MKWRVRQWGKNLREIFNRRYPICFSISSTYSSASLAEMNKAFFPVRFNSDCPFVIHISYSQHFRKPALRTCHLAADPELVSTWSSGPLGEYSQVGVWGSNR